MKAIVGIVCAAVGVILALTIVLGSWYTIDQGERGVLLRNGAVIGTAEPGLGFKTPWIEDVVEISVQTQTRTFTKLVAYSRDQQPAEMRVSVTYRLLPDQVVDIYSQFGGADGIATRLLDPRVHSETKTVFGRFNAITAIQDRTRLNTDVAAAVRDAVDGPMIVESVQIENIDFSDAYEASIEQRMLAEVEVQKLQQNAEREKVQAQIAVTQANARADAVRAAALADSEAIRLRGDAEAAAIRARGTALAENPLLPQLVVAERWDGVLPRQMVPGSAVPFLNLTDPTGGK